MDFVKQVRVGHERAKTGVCAKIDRPPFVLDAGKVGGIRVTENSSTKSDESFIRFRRRGHFRLWHNKNPAAREAA